VGFALVTLSLRRLHHTALFLGFSTLLSACATAPFVWVQAYPQDAEPVRNDSNIRQGDVVEVRVFGQDSLTTKATVRSDGSITVPLLGQVPIAGQAPAAVAAQLATRLSPFVTDPRVTVVVLQSLVSVTAVGAVQRAGIMEIEAPVNVLKALANAGGLGKFASRDGIYVLREVNGQTQRIRFSYKALTDGSPRAAQFRLKSGDILFVED
jgi:polysaccharide export outer membrane protein